MDRIQERKERWIRFYENREAPPFLYIIKPPAHGPRPMLWPDNQEEQHQWILREYENQIKSLDWLESDLIPHASMTTGTEIFAEAFGCPVHRPDFTNPFALPRVKNAGEADRLEKPALEDTPLMLQLERAERVRRALGKDAVLQLVDMQTPLDVTALIWEKEDFFPAMIGEARSVKALAAKVLDLQIDFFDQWRERFGKEFVAHYPCYYMPDGITFSEDEIGTISPAMFEEFCLDELNILGNRYGGLGIHCCADSFHQWDNFLKMEPLKILNLNQPIDVLEKGFSKFESKIKYLPIQVDFDGNALPLEPRADHRGIVYVFSPGTREEALRLAGKLGEMRES